MNLPISFTQRMSKLLGSEYQEFLECYEKEKKQGLRVNTSKISVEEFLQLTKFQLTPIPWTSNGFFYQAEDGVTHHPHYYAGLYYVQEPSAMVPASRLPIVPGERVLDLCAAPGGKATELGARLRGTGMLSANDVSISRAKGLLKNIESFGIANSFVTGETPERLAACYPEYFDKILVDAPCSGEGMFRKDPGLIRSWEERGPEYYAPLQKQILDQAVAMLRPGGMLLYSTCTFSPEEDEAVICHVLEHHPDLHMAAPEGYAGFAPGLAQVDGLDLTGGGRFQPEKCIRIWPHRMDGEGHFAALLQKENDGSRRTCAVQNTAAGAVRVTAGKKSGRDSRNGAAKEMTSQLPKEAEVFLQQLSWPLLEKGTLSLKQDSLYWLPEELQLTKLRYLRTGLLIGTMKRDRFEPSQALAMALTKDSFPKVLDLPGDHPGILRYLKGETLDLEETQQCPKGWILICCDGYPLGWGKEANGRIKNKYYPGWRMQ